MKKNKTFGILIYRVEYNNSKNVLNNKSKIEFLFLKASYEFLFYKGLHEENENGLETAMRETFEETGLNKDKYKLLNFEKTLIYNVKDKTKETTYYLAGLLNNDENIKLSDEHTDFKWIHSNESDVYSLPDSFAELMKSAEEFIRKIGK
ncbi:bis(5'-nucleosyl)-tetraphosphatase [asymmetrical], putative [Plasmodium gallinaceum]|uniref:Bis(5'-nucleosyl)-tetraphosphatase [asymmetrical], putative n=1 Tax=Plasmodium gallinaceum TaxID=5849 RepID=A0A1J1GNX0_PLAGA|nr:bis(5'-nucleosyl)-tetraphosphatase [asymmetrical], putative [Plasmodium gallinaceum]CRG92975.1 bis(5'-nucleosyl)-tetraphosphatase [asymmetrical], putative [Plasmodium gallinaceum]